MYTSYLVFKEKVKLLNPHGSDETRKSRIYQCSMRTLLNPHGSDETSDPAHYDLFRLDFLTHTVQMKLLLFPSVFIEIKLLNPHGSDETLKLISIAIEKCYFLTHTVQMKQYMYVLPQHVIVSFLTHTVQMKRAKR